MLQARPVVKLHWQRWFLCLASKQNGATGSSDSRHVTIHLDRDTFQQYKTDRRNGLMEELKTLVPNIDSGAVIGTPLMLLPNL